MTTPGAGPAINHRAVQLRQAANAPVHDRGRVLADTTVMNADGGRVLSDLAVLREHGELFGPVASDPTRCQPAGLCVCSRLCGSVTDVLVLQIF